MTWNKPYTMIVCLMAVVAAISCSSAIELETEEAKTLYALGLAMAQSAEPFALTSDELAIVQAGFEDGVLKSEQKVNLDDYRNQLQEFARTRVAAAVERIKQEGNSYREEQAKLPGAQKTESGMVYFETAAGAGSKPTSADTVTLHYHGTLPDGTVFDSSVEKGQPATFPLNGVVPCFSEGVQKIAVGGKGKLICPPNLAYGDQGSGRIPPGSTIIFDVELLEIAGQKKEESSP